MRRLGGLPYRNDVLTRMLLCKIGGKAHRTATSGAYTARLTNRTMFGISKHPKPINPAPAKEKAAAAPTAGAGPAATDRRP